MMKVFLFVMAICEGIMVVYKRSLHTILRYILTSSPAHLYMVCNKRSTTCDGVLADLYMVYGDVKPSNGSRYADSLLLLLNWVSRTWCTWYQQSIMSVLLILAYTLLDFKWANFKRVQLGLLRQTSARI